MQFVDANGMVALHYRGLTVHDADGRTVPARFEASDWGLLLTVEEHQARYPINIDPIAQQAYLKASNTDFWDHFGSVAVSAVTHGALCAWTSSRKALSSSFIHAVDGAEPGNPSQRAGSRAVANRATKGRSRA